MQTFIGRKLFGTRANGRQQIKDRWSKELDATV